MNSGNVHSRPSRRQFLSRLGVAGGSFAAAGSILASCAIPTSESTQEPTSTQPSTPTSAPVPASASRITIGTAIGEFNNLSPWDMGLVNYPFPPSLFNVPLRYNHELMPTPELATHWSVSPDAKSVTLKLREGVKFHNGQEMTAEDFVKNVDAARTVETGYHLYSMVAGIETVEALDKNTVIITFASPTPSVIDILESLYVIEPGAIPALSNSAIGTGPFKFVEWIPGDHVKLERFPDYWEKPKPYVDEVMFKFYDDTDSMVSALEGGLIDVVFSFPPKDVSRLEDQVDIDRGQKGAGFYLLYLNPLEDPLNKKEVRQALALAVDRDAILRNVLFGIGDPMYQYWPEFSPAYDENFDFPKYDLDQAKQLLAEAGYPNGFKVTMTQNAGSQDGVAMAQLVQADLAQIGVEIEIEPLEAAQFYPRFSEGNYQMMIATNAFTHKYPTAITTGRNFRTVNNTIWHGDPPKAYADAIAAANVAVDPVEQKAAFDRISGVLLDECWGVPIAWRYALLAKQKFVKGLDWSVDDHIIPTGAWLEK